MSDNKPSRDNGILYLIDHIDEYIDRIISGELNWTELLESKMSPGALEVKKTIEKKVSE